MNRNSEMSYDSNNNDDLDELLSAYLDGEVTADERALVERRLAESVEFRQLHDELRALRTSLERLPRYKLDEDLAPVVLRRAERAMLSAPSVSQLVDTSGDAKVSLADRGTPSAHSRSAMRLLRWPVLAVAIALLIMVFNPPTRRENREVARKDAAAPDPKSEMSAAKSKESRDDRDLDVADAPALSHIDEVQQIAPAASPTEALPVDAGRALGRQRADSKHRISGSDGRFADSKDAERGAPAGKAGPVSKSKAPAAYVMTDGSVIDGVMIVQCDISAEAAKSRAFEQLLTDQQISMVDEAAEGETPELKPQAPGANLSTKSAAETSSRPLAKSGKETFAKGAAADKLNLEEADSDDRSGQPSGAGGETAEVEAFLVEASPEQIEGTLAGLESRKDLFLTVTIQEPATNGPADLRPQNQPASEVEPKQATKFLNKAESLKPRESNTRQGVNESLRAAMKRQLQGTDPTKLPVRATQEAAGRRLGESLQPDEVSQSSTGSGSTRANARRLLMEPGQFREMPPRPEPASGAKHDVDRETTDRFERAKAEKKVASGRVPTPSEPLVTEAPAAGKLTTPPVPSAQTETTSQLGALQAADDETTDVRAPKVRALFLFRVVPSAEQSR